MELSTLPRYWAGQREAILKVAGWHAGLPVGALFVLSAGLAREYARTHLLAEPWHLLVPFVVSMLAALVVVFLLRISTENREDAPKFCDTYARVLKLIWFTAPLAWLYAIPYERFMPAGSAASARLATLALVSIWRVMLTARFMSVLAQRSFLSNLMLVMFPADLVALIAIYWLPFPVLDVMSGIRLSAQDRALRTAAEWVLLVGLPSLLVWFIGSVYAVCAKSRWNHVVEVRQRAPGVVMLAVASVAAWVVILPQTQPQARRVRAVERSFLTSPLAGLRMMNTHEPADFPPDWEPPPRIRAAGDVGNLAAVIRASREIELKPWLRAMLTAKLTQSFSAFGWYWWFDEHPDDIDAIEQFVRSAREIDAAEQARMLSQIENWRERHRRLTTTQPATAP